MHEAVRDALLLFEEACSRSGHELCLGRKTCIEGLEAVGRWRHEQATASQFDAARQLMLRQEEMPSHDWSTPELLLFAAEQLKRQPNLDSLWRATSITTALARLGERGLPVDCMVRTCMGQDLLRHIIIVISNVWSDINDDSRSRADYPELEGWLRAVDDDPVIKGGWAGDRGWVITRSLQGVPRERGEEWLRDAALSHLLAWRLDDYMRSPVSPDDLFLPCGDAGTRWVYERFTKTYADEWSEASRSWETAFRADSGAVARSVGVPEVILRERMIPDEQLTRATVRSVMQGSTAATVDGISVAEIIEIALVQLEEGFFEGARQLSDKASKQIPQHENLRLLRAFAHLSTEPSVSRDVLRRMLAEGEVERSQTHILRADIAASHLMEDGAALAIEEVAKIPRSETRANAWLWDPISLPEQPRVRYSALEDWLHRFDDAVSQ